MRILAIIFTTCLCLTSCVQCDIKESLSKQLSKHKARTFSVWADWQKKGLREKIGPAPDVLVNYLQIDNKLHGYSLVPKPAEEWKPFAEDVAHAIEEFPLEVRRQFDKYVIGIFLVTNLGASGYTDLLNDFDKHPLGFIVLDIHVLDKKANEWASWRENTPFKLTSGLEVRVQIEPETRDIRKNALSYIILHELGHLVGVAKGMHGNWQVKGNPADYAFASLSWTLQNGSIFSKWDSMFPDRSRIRFYADEKCQFPGDKLTSVYADLVKTDFVSLYAATGIYDDFAEAYAMYVHCVLQQRPWLLNVLRNGKSVFTMNEPIQEERCLGKRTFLTTLFEKESQPVHAGDGNTRRQHMSPSSK